MMPAGSMLPSLDSAARCAVATSRMAALVPVPLEGS